MAIREVLTYPHPALKSGAEKIPGLTADVIKVVEDLKHTMLACPHSTGIAAPQIGESCRVVVLDASRNKKCADNHGPLVMINPEITAHEGVVTFREGCMSVPDFTGNVNRAQSVKVRFLNENFEPYEIDASGFESVLIQHETDHLDGILFIDRVISKRTDLFKRKNYK